MLASDLIGSRPVFYSIYQNNIYISDDALFIAQEIHAKLDGEAVSEYYSAFFVSYDRTLFKGIKQVLPGEFVIIYKDKPGKIEKYKYYVLDYHESRMETEETFKESFYKVLYQVFLDLVHRMNGRTAVVPLSGGFDSRTIAVMLRECNYHNVICFSYGKKDNYEAKVSEMVARTLGYPWVFIEYNGFKWHNTFASVEYEKFLVNAGRGRSTGCIQGLPAILELKRRQLIPDDSIIIPGHTLDVLAGSHIHMKDSKFPITKKRYLENLIDIHYSNSRRMRIKEMESIISSESVPEMIDRSTYLMLNQRFEYYNRQNKFVANDIKTYESAGYECELPFWDIRICDFWQQVPFDFLCNRNLQKDFTETYINPKCGLKEKECTEIIVKKSDIKKRIKEVVKCIPFIKKWGYIFYLALFGKYNNEGDWPAFWDMKRMEYLIYCLRHGGMTVNGRAAKDYVALLRKELQ